MASVILSILIPSYNRPDYLLELLKNLDIGNLRKDLEVIVSDDCSPQQREIKHICNSFKDKNFSFELLSKNIGEVENKIGLLERAKGEYITFIGDDDLINNKVLDQILSIIQSKNSVDVYYLGYEIIDIKGNYQSKHVASKNYDIKEDDLAIKKLIFETSTLPMWHFHPATYVCKREVALIESFSKDYGMAEDLNFVWQSISKGYKIHVIGEIFLKWRKHKETDQKNQSSMPMNNLIARKKFLSALRQNKFSLPGFSDLEGVILDHFILAAIAKDLHSKNATQKGVIDLFGRDLSMYKKYNFTIRFPLLFITYVNLLRTLNFVKVFGLREFLKIAFNKI